ncbi:MAG: hypothetical protein EA402_05400 [Planctomycetota bacterium]|nr:MAG: hypothetical protein EA402_05400 [Planctomycetota bacterium]
MTVPTEPILGLALLISRLKTEMCLFVTIPIRGEGFDNQTYSGVIGAFHMGIIVATGGRDKARNGSIGNGVPAATTGPMPFCDRMCILADLPRGISSHGAAELTEKPKERDPVGP